MLIIALSLLMECGIMLYRQNFGDSMEIDFGDSIFTFWYNSEVYMVS